MFFFLYTAIWFQWVFPSHVVFIHLFLFPSAISLIHNVLDISMLCLLSSLFLSSSLGYVKCIDLLLFTTEFILAEDLCIVSSCDSHLLGSLASSISLLEISVLTLRSKCEHILRIFGARNVSSYFGKFSIEKQNYMHSPLYIMYVLTCN